MNPEDVAHALMKIWHDGQFRRDNKTPYWTHPERVAKIVREIQYGIYSNNSNLVVSALLHDVLEDTDVKEEDIKSIFGDSVLNIVKELTFPSDLSDETYRDYCKALSPTAKIIKTADIIANITDVGYKSPHFIEKRLNALKAMWNE